VRYEVLDAGEHLTSRLAVASLVVAHPPSRDLRPRGDLVRPPRDVSDVFRSEEAAEPEPAVPPPMLHLGRVEHPGSLPGDRALGQRDAVGDLQVRVPVARRVGGEVSARGTPIPDGDATRN